MAGGAGGVGAAAPPPPDAAGGAGDAATPLAASAPPPASGTDEEVGAADEAMLLVVLCGMKSGGCCCCRWSARGGADAVRVGGSIAPCCAGALPLTLTMPAHETPEPGAITAGWFGFTAAGALGASASPFAAGASLPEGNGSASVTAAA